MSKKDRFSKSNATAEVFYTAFQALRPAEKKAVLRRVLRNKRLREDMMDLATIASRENEPSRPFREYLQRSRGGASKSA